MKKLAGFIFLALAMVAYAQQPQTSTDPIFAVNSEYVQGVGIGYWPTAGSGLVLDVSAGTANCLGSMVSYAGGTLTMTASATNYVYLNASSSCAPAVKSTTFVAADVPIAIVVAGSSTITTVTDERTMMTAISQTATGIAVGTTAISGGASGDILYDNAGTLGNLATTGSGNVVLATSPSISGLTVTSSFTATGLVTNSDLANASTTVNGQTCTLGGSCTVTTTASSITVGTTTVSSGTSGYILYDNSGTLGNLGTTGSGNVVLAGSPTITGTLSTGKISISGATLSPDLLITDTGTGNYIASIEALAPNTPSGDITGQIHFGVALSSYNDATMFFTYAGGAGSTSNYGSLSIFNVNNILNWFGTGDVSIGSTTDCGFVLCAAGEIVSTTIGAYGSFRMIEGNYGAIWRPDGTNLYLLLTASGNQYGTFNSLRPFIVNESTGSVGMENGVNIVGGLSVDTISAMNHPIVFADMSDSTYLASQVVMYFTSTLAQTIPSGGSSTKLGIACTSKFTLTTAATASTTFNIRYNGTSFGTIVFAASGTSGTITISSAESIASGGIITVTAPSTADSTAAGLYGGLCSYY